MIRYPIDDQVPGDREAGRRILFHPVVLEARIVERKIRKESPMPEHVVKALTHQEPRDLSAWLVQKR